MQHQSPSPLLTDLYQLTMAQGYWQNAMRDHEAVFHLYFRKLPFDGGYAIACGLEQIIEFLQDFQFSQDELTYLSSLKGTGNRALFEHSFLQYLAEMEFSCTVHGIPEGTVVFPNEPLLRVQGPLIQCQLLETTLLNLINFQTLIATKASRICRAAGDGSVMEFGLRRAQGPDGGLTASRAAYIGGCSATSNVLAGMIYDIPVKGTMAHSWVQSFDTEADAFESYARSQPHNSVFLVDTYDSIEGIRQAIRAGDYLRNFGFDITGIRLDSGDLIELSKRARHMLDEAGFELTDIVASNDLDEYEISRLLEAGAKINVWGVGTRLATSWEQPALGGVYKLGAIRSPGAAWQPKLKRSDSLAKSSLPGILQVRRFSLGGKIVADLIYNELEEKFSPLLNEGSKDELYLSDLDYEALLQPVFREGQLHYINRDIHHKRQYAHDQLQRLPEELLTLKPEDGYPVGIEPHLRQHQRELIEELTQRSKSNQD